MICPDIPESDHPKGMIRVRPTVERARRTILASSILSTLGPTVTIRVSTSDVKSPITADKNSLCLIT